MNELSAIYRNTLGKLKSEETFLLNTQMDLEARHEHVGQKLLPWVQWGEEGKATNDASSSSFSRNNGLFASL